MRISFLTTPFRSRENAPFLEYVALKEAKFHDSVKNIYTLYIIYSCMKSEVIKSLQF